MWGARTKKRGARGGAPARFLPAREGGRRTTASVVIGSSRCARRSAAVRFFSADCSFWSWMPRTRLSDRPTIIPICFDAKAPHCADATSTSRSGPSRGYKAKIAFQAFLSSKRAGPPRDLLVSVQKGLATANQRSPEGVSIAISSSVSSESSPSSVSSPSPARLRVSGSGSWSRGSKSSASVQELDDSRSKLGPCPQVSLKSRF